jgi:eukaryotic-like serine/threonine-protein kinase
MFCKPVVGLYLSEMSMKRCIFINLVLIAVMLVSFCGGCDTMTTLPERIIDDKGVEMALLPAGEFLMGANDSDPDANTDEKPQHQVTLDAYYIDVYEVTNASYALCVQDGACTEPYYKASYMRSEYYGNPQYDNYPVIWVDWNQAEAFCEWRGGVLPTEAQWEKAARGPDGRLYPWGDEVPDCTRANYWGQSGGCVGDTSPVGSYPLGASPSGLMDMIGNVREWVMDWYNEYYYGIQSKWINPLGPESGHYRVLRGGSLVNLQKAIRCTSRYGATVDLRDDNVGFRCSRTP